MNGCSAMTGGSCMQYALCVGLYYHSTLCVGKMGAEKSVASDLISWDEGEAHEEPSGGASGGWDHADWDSVDIKSGKSD